MHPADVEVFKTSSGRLTTKPDVVTTSYRKRLIYDVLKTSDLRHLEDVRFTTPWRRLIYVVLKTSDLRHLEDVWFTFWRRPIYDVLKTSDSRLLEDVRFTMSWRCLINDVLKTSVKQRLLLQRCSDIYTAPKEMIFSYHIQKILKGSA